MGKYGALTAWRLTGDTRVFGEIVSVIIDNQISNERLNQRLHGENPTNISLTCGTAVRVVSFAEGRKALD
jgi:hypothetical protein